LGGFEDIYYSSLLNKLLWEQGVYTTFNHELEDQAKDGIVVKEGVIARQQSFGTNNIKTMKFWQYRKGRNISRLYLLLTMKMMVC